MHLGLNQAKQTERERKSEREKKVIVHTHQAFKMGKKALWRNEKL